MKDHSCRKSRRGRRRQAAGHSFISSPYARRLRAEQLEDRRLLAVLTVNSAADNTLDDGLITLREAIYAANYDSVADATEGVQAGSGVDRIQFDTSVFTGGSANLIRLTSGSQLGISDSLTIDGAAVFEATGEQIVISGDSAGNDSLLAGTLITDVASSLAAKQLDDNTRVLSFVSSTGNLTLADLAITGGRAPKYWGHGGGIRFDSEGTLAITGSTVSGNSVTESDNHGGGIYTDSGSVELTTSTINGNTSISSGGGIYTYSGSVEITSSTVSDNTSGRTGGGIYARSGLVELTNSTVSSNTSGSSGGGIYTYSGSVEITSSTVSGNAADGAGGGIFAYHNAYDSAANRSLSVENSIIAGNFDHQSPTNGGTPNDLIPDPDSTLTVNHSLLGVADGLTIAGSTGNLTGTAASPLDPLLGPLADNGGRTRTHALLPGSPAIDAGDPSLHFQPDSYDQRGAGFHRVQFDRLDMGAFERGLVVDLAADVLDGVYTLGNLSLREAVSLANAIPGTDTITFDANVFTGGRDSLIRLTQGELEITEALTIDGSSAAGIVISGDSAGDDSLRAETLITDVASSWAANQLEDNTRVLNFSSSTGNLTLAGLTVTGGYETALNGRGGGVYFNSDGVLTLTGSTVSGNAGSMDGGGIYAGSGSVRLRTTTVSDNISGGLGGGIATSSGSVTLAASTVSGNRATGLFADGGGIYVASGAIALTKSTVSGNSSGRDGGGIHSGSGAVTLTSSTVSGNAAARAGGGVFVANTATNPSFTIENSIVADNHHQHGSPNDLMPDPGSALTINYSLVGVTDGLAILGNTGNRTGTAASPLDPLLGPLVDNGGPTQTHALLPESPAIHAGNPSAGSLPDFDQRGIGFPRVRFGRLDMGAIEFDNTTVPAQGLVVDLATDEFDGNYSAGNLSLREASWLANANLGPNTITFDTNVFTGGNANLLRLTQGELQITGTLTIDGSDTAGIVISGDSLGNDHLLSNTLITDVEQSSVEHQLDDNTRVLNFSSATGDLTLASLTVTGGHTISNDSQGGGIRFDSTGILTLTDSTVSGNSTMGYGSHGGAIATDRGSVVLTNSTVSDNSTAGGNAYGGGIYTYAGAVTSVDSTISGNSVTGSRGAKGGGGGLFVDAGSVTLIGSTLSGNSSSNFGGGLATLTGPVTIANSTVTGNAAAQRGGGIYGSLYDFYRNPNFTIENSIVAGNLGYQSPHRSGTPNDLALSSGIRLTVNHSLLGVADGLKIADNVGNLTGTEASPLDPLLGPLADNGGPTQTHALLPGSPAIDAGDPSVPFRPHDFDQRGAGYPRVQFGRLDSGAVEQGLLVDLATDASDGNYTRGNLSLREAITLANLIPGLETITFDPNVFTGGNASLIRLSQGELEITDALTIDGSAAVGIVISGDAAGNDSLLAGTLITDIARSSAAHQLDDNTQVLNFSSPRGDLTLTGLTVTGGYEIDSEERGGGIRFDSDGALALNNSTVRGNASGRDGGGIFAGSGAVALTQSTISDNISGGRGGGIAIGSGSVTLMGSTISGNRTTGFFVDGGGIFADSGAVALTQSTISGNSSGRDGGGIYTSSGSLELNGSTVSGNLAARSGGGVFVSDNATNPALRIENSILAGNLDHKSPTNNGTPNDLIPDPDSVLTINYSLVGVADGLVITGNTGNLTGTAASPLDPQLGPLADHGGPTQTRVLLPGSPAIDAGDPSVSFHPHEFDQRGVGFPRVKFDRLDIGAMEFAILPPQGLVVDLATDEVDGNYAPGNLSLREAILLANAVPGPNTITFDANRFPGGGDNLIRLTQGELEITETLVIDGSAAPGVVISGDSAGNDSLLAGTLITSTASSVADQLEDNTRVLNFSSSTGDLTLAGLTVTGGHTMGYDNGGGIRFGSDGTLVLSGSSVSGNTGGGIRTFSGAVVLTSSSVRGNTTESDGGGISTYAGSVTLADSTVDGNSSRGNGGGISTYAGSITLANSTVRGNSTLAFDAHGGGIATVTGPVMLTDTTISDNSTAGGFPDSGGIAYGGGIYTDTGAVTLTESTIRGNTSGDDGGGIYTHSGSVELSSSMVVGNRTSGFGAHGGGIATDAGSVTLTDSTVRDNTTVGWHAYGGGIYSYSGTVTLISSTASGNSTTGTNDIHGGGGAIFVDFGAVTLNRSTLSGNSSSGEGGGITTRSGPVTITDSTITGNEAAEGGGGIYFHLYKQTRNRDLTIENSIVAGNLDHKSAGHSGTPNDVVVDRDNYITPTINHSLIGVTDELTILGNTGNLTGTAADPLDPRLGPLANNGGPTQTHALLPDSPAIDAGDPSVSFQTDDFDQRGVGFPRVEFGRVDIGAMEFKNPTLPPQGLVVDLATDELDGNYTAGDLSLREAILIANAHPRPDTITFDAHVFTGGSNSLLRLTQGELQITDSLTIDGTSAVGIVISGDSAGDDSLLAGTLITDVAQSSVANQLDDNTRVLNFLSPTGNLTLVGLTVTGGHTTSFLEHGGGVRFDSDGSLALIGSKVRGNTSGGDGGGISVASGVVELTGSTVRDNTSGRNGGGICNYFGAVTLRSDSAVFGNTSESRGGGIHSYSGSVEFTSSTVRDNSSKDQGGGIYSSGALTLTGSTVSGNSSEEQGGGIYGFGTLTLSSSTVSGNSSEDQGGGIYSFGTLTLSSSTVSGNSSKDHGGGVSSYFGSVGISSSTVSDNEAAGAGGGFFVLGNPTNPSFTMENSIVAGNLDHKSPGNSGTPNDLFADPSSTLTVNYSLVGVTDGLLFAGNTGNLTGTVASPLDPLLGLLADHGGPTQTHALLPGSPAIDAGDPSVPFHPDDFDQRGVGFPRVQFRGLDMGAVERGKLVVDLASDAIDGIHTAGNMSLREAIMLANANPGPDTITFDAHVFTGGNASLIRLTQGELEITEALTIDGSDALEIVLSGDASGDDHLVAGTLITDVARSSAANLLSDNTRVLNFSSSNGDLVLTGLTITGGSTIHYLNRGGGVLFDSEGALILTNSTVRGNTSEDRGGGIYSSSGPITLTGSTVSDNTTENRGGGVFSYSSPVTLTDSTVRGNISRLEGGGIYSYFDSVQLAGSTIHGNISGNDGGGIYTHYRSTELMNSTVSGNSSKRHGGGIYTHSRSTKLTDSVVSGNSSEGDGGGIYSKFTSLTNSDVRGNSSGRDGGGVYNAGEYTYYNATLINSTIGDNTSGRHGGGVYSSGGVTLASSTVRGNSSEDQGGGIYSSGVVELTSSTVSYNIGGGINNTTSDMVKLTNSTVSSNVGGGIRASSGEVVLASSRVSDNTSPDYGGGIYTRDSVTLTDSEVRGNASQGNGGGIYSRGSFVQLTNSVVSGNRAAGHEAHGGGIATDRGRVTLLDSVVSDNKTVGQYADGGGIYTYEGEITLTGSTVHGNTSRDDGGGIYTDSGAVELTSSTVSGNSTEGSSAFGGGIANLRGSILLTDSTVSNNSTAGQNAWGGGIYNYLGSVELIGSTISGNSTASLGGHGGGIAIGSGSVVFTDSTISDNSTAGQDAHGGGIYSAEGTVTSTGSTVSGNRVTGTSGIHGGGGGIFVDAGSVTLTQSTLSGNSSRGEGGGLITNAGPVTITDSTVTGNAAARDGGGIYSFLHDPSGNQILTIENSIVAGNLDHKSSGHSGTPNDVIPAPNSTLTIHYSLIGVADGLSPLGNTGNLTGTAASPLDPLLGPLADNGGLTQTHALLPGSPAINAGDPSVSFHPEDFDQRGLGFPRVQIERVDIGAVEQGLVVDLATDEFDGDYTAGDLSLREAIWLANTIPGPDTILFDAHVFTGGADSLIRLTQGELEISETLIIDGSGARGVVISGDSQGNDHLVAGTLITDVSLSSAADQLADNTPVLNFSSPTGDLTLAGLTVTGGHAARRSGSGVHFGSNGTLALTGSSVAGNSGGGVHAIFGSVTLAESTVRGNVGGDHGGGIYALFGSITLTESTVSGNTSAASGGGIYTHSGAVTVAQSTISSNISGNHGGGIFAGSDLVTLTSSTVYGNQAAGEGGGVFLFDSKLNPSMTIENSILAGNLSHQSPGHSGTPSDLVPDPDSVLAINYSLIGVADGLSMRGHVGNLTGTAASPLDPLLGPLADNGGPTQTHALLPESPALNAGDPHAVSRTGFDQRGVGFPRVRFGQLDIGAVEFDNTTIPAQGLVVDMATDAFDGNYAVGDLTLREAIRLANANPGLDTITFDAHVFSGGNASLLRLTEGTLQITESLRIDGSSAVGVVISGDSAGDDSLLAGTLVTDVAASEAAAQLDDNTRVLSFSSSTGDLTLTGLTVTGGHTSSAQEHGGAVYFDSDGTLILADSAIRGNISAGDGGGIYTAAGGVQLTGSTIRGNISRGDGGGVRTHVDSVALEDSTVSDNIGGGIVTSSSGAVTLTRSTVSGNKGGGIQTSSGAVELTSSSVRSNTNQDSGGGIYTYSGSVTLADSMVRDNTSGGHGGGIATGTGSVMLTDSTVSDNSTAGDSTRGGGIYTDAGAVTLTSSKVSSNASEDRGGGISTDLGAVELTNSTVSGNSTSGFGAHGGGIATHRGSVLLTDSTVCDNSTAGEHAYGGGIFSYAGALTSIGSTVSGNRITGTSGIRGGGGGIFVDAGAVTLTRSTLSGNHSTGEGGGINTRTGPMTITDSTVTGNEAARDGGGIYFYLHSRRRNPAITIENSIVAGNLDHKSAENSGAPNDLVTHPDSVLTINDSLVGVADGLLIAGNTGNLTGTAASPLEPRLGPLANNGGPTQTHALLPGSPALDAGLSTAIVDQRGWSRPAQDADMGAYEAQISPSADFNADGVVNGLDFLAWQLGFSKANAQRADGNSDDDTDVDASDLAAWRVSYGQVQTPPPDSAPVEEQSAASTVEFENTMPSGPLFDLTPDSAVNRPGWGAAALEAQRIDAAIASRATSDFFPAEVFLPQGIASPAEPIDLAFASDDPLPEITSSVKNARAIGPESAEPTSEPWLEEELLERVFAET